MKMNNRSVVIFCFFIFLALPVINFANEVDSLKKILTTNIPDTTKVNVLNALSKAYFNDNPDSSISIAISSKKIAEEIHFNAGLALALKNMGIGYYLKGKYVDAIKIWDKAIEQYTTNSDKKGIANIYSNQGAIYFAQGDDAKSLELHLKSFKMSEELNDTLRIVSALINVGGVYSNKKVTYDKALEYFIKAYHLSKIINDKSTIGASAVNIGETYFKLGNYKTALEYYFISKKAYENSEDLPYTLNDIGKLYTIQKEFEKAIKIHNEAFDFSKKLDTKLDQTQSLVGLAQAYLAKEDYFTAIQKYKQSLLIAIPLSAVTEIKDAYQGLTEAYSKQSDLSNAFKYQNLLLAIKDTIYDINTDKKLGTLQFTFDLENKETQISLLNKDKLLKAKEIQRQKVMMTSFIGGFIVVLLFAIVVFKQRNKISKEKQRSEELLLNILPAETAEELKTKGSAESKLINSVTVLFTDFKGFTQLSEKLTAKELVGEINECFSAFDHIMQRHGIEKIKTIGDSYMAAGGLPAPNETHATDVINAAFEIQKFMEDHKAKKIASGQLFFEIRIGINTGSVVAGIVGIKKFSYDIWGDTVNTASRMESSGEVGKVNISGSTYELIKDKFQCVHRGKIAAKGKGDIDMYFVEKV